MSIQTIIGIVAAILIVGGGAWYMSSNTTVTTDEQSEVSQGENSGNATFGALIAMGGSRTCTTSVVNADMTANGTVYISGDRVRGDFTTTTNGQSMTGHMLQADGYVYSWSDAMPQGVKMPLSAQSSAASSQTIDPSAEVTYDCSMGVRDESVFTVPGTVTFMELGATGSIPAGMMPR